MKRALVLGAGGFIGHHLVGRLVAEGIWVRGVDLRRPAFSVSLADDFVIGDLRDRAVCERVFATPEGGSFDEVYQLAADMGGADYVFSGAYDFEILANNGLINHNVALASRRRPPGRLFFASSACVYPRGTQTDPERIDCREDMAYPADPDSPYGWEKLHAETLFLELSRAHDVPVRIARYHNIFGPEGAWDGGREKAPAALCRKVARARDGEAVPVHGDGQQMRSFLEIEEALDGTLRLMRGPVAGPLNIGSDETIRIADMLRIVGAIAGKSVRAWPQPDKPMGVRARTSDNTRIAAALDWRPTRPLRAGLTRLYPWIAAQVAATDRLTADTAA